MLLTRGTRIKKWSPETETSGRKERVNSHTKRGLFRELNEAPMQQILSVLVYIPATHQPEPLVDGSWCTNAPAPSPLGWNHLEVQVQHSLPELTVVTYLLLDAFPVFLPFPTPLPLSPGIIFPIHYLHLSCRLRSASGTTQTKTSYEVRIIVPTLQTRERRLKVTQVLLPCPPTWILGFTPSYVTTCTSGKPMGGSILIQSVYAVLVFLLKYILQKSFQLGLEVVKNLNRFSSQVYIFSHTQLVWRP